MARLDSTERKQLRTPPREDSSPPPALLPAREYVAFASFSSRFLPAGKPRPFARGRHWKL